MIQRSKWLVVHGVTAKEWGDRYDIEPYTRPCSACGAPCETTVPFACGTLRGLASPTCACGNVNTPYCVVRDPKHGDLFTGGKL